MRYLTKLISLLLVLTMVMALAATVCATTANPGSIQIKNATNVSVAGKTFNAYKILDVEAYTGSGADAKVVYLVPSEMKPFYQNRYTLTGDEGDFDARVAAGIEAEADRFAFAADALAAAKTAYSETPAKSVTAGDSADSVTIDDLPLGYYVVEDAGNTAVTAPISALMLSTTNPKAIITLKADKPTIDKTIDGSGKNNNAAVGDSVDFKITSNVPEMTGYEKYYFVVTDTLSKGLTFQEDNVTIQIGGVSLSECTHSADQAHENCYTITSESGTDGATILKIVFKNFIQYADHEGAAITIQYSAIINENAVIGTEGNKNAATLTYSNNPNIKDDGDPSDPDEPDKDSPTGTTPAHETYTYVTGIELIKVDPQGNRLTGAEFKLEGDTLNTVLVRKEVFKPDANGTYWKLKDGTYTTVDPNGLNVDKDAYESLTDKYTLSSETQKIEKAETVNYTGAVGGDGVLRFDGLPAGIYTITETKAPSGYNMLKDPIQVAIQFTEPAQNSTECTWNYVWTVGTSDTVTSADNTVTVTNKAGTELPSTGGIGTTVFYVIGTILLVGAGALLVAKRRMNAEK